jgi:flavin reductase (DIM6/NTAB) family NADH-FMN oxidoreductase RutF
MTDASKSGIAQALGCIPQSLYIMTSAYEDRMRGVMVSFVQQMGFDPPMISVALSKGRPIVPLLHDSHSFAICQIPPTEKLIMKRFAGGADAGDNAFEGLEIRRGKTGSPILKKGLAYLDCELVRHIDVEGDHDIYIGLVRDAERLRTEDPIVRLRDNGLTY